MQVQTYTTQTTLEGSSYLMEEVSIAAFNRVLQRFSPISLAEMDDVALLRRVDTKYVMSEAQLYQALAHLTEEYNVLSIAGRRLHHYQTLYFDTPDFNLYRQHHDGWHNRYKVRFRAYVDSDLAFLEVKHKTNKNVTVKHRVQTSEITTRVDAYAGDFLQTCFPYQVEGLEPKLWNTFQRMTLVSKHTIERLTLDIALGFGYGDIHVTLPGVVIAEIKQEGFSLTSDFIGQMRTLGVRPMGFSKYCMGVSLLYDQVKSNNFKPQRLYINKIMRERN
ncbi:MAG: polyphosphate polymerase domain-containing protein [Anaerolineae bacterium]|nr:polyphosphate polymerase domain-containing protein [Anaerolineae bacterium]